MLVNGNEGAVVARRCCDVRVGNFVSLYALLPGLLPSLKVLGSLMGLRNQEEGSIVCECGAGEEV